jgi:hypothetical protein
MNRFKTKFAIALLATALAAAVGAQGNPNGLPPGILGAAPDPMVGVWVNTVALRNCTTGIPTVTLQTQAVYNAGGTLSVTTVNPFNGPHYGVWSREGDVINIKFRFFRFNPDWSLAGVGVTTRRLALAADGNSGVGTFLTELFDVHSNLLAQVCGTDTAARFK